jgi:uncharacterized Fe-S radical SAM superfamily protein PflX
MKPKRKRVEDRSPQANYAQRQIAAGHCRVCGWKCTINRRTGKHYLLCPVHLVSVAKTQKLLMRRRRAK